MAIILGIDPGSRKLGYGVIFSKGQKLTHIDNGTLEIPLTDIPNRLGYIYRHLSALITQFKPELFAIEEVFVHKNVSAALKLGQARGAAILAAVNQNIPVVEYAPRTIKQAVVGKGGADKFQIQQMVKLLLNLPEVPLSDAADALAIAICCANNHKSASSKLINDKTNNKLEKYSRGRWR